MGKSIKEGSVSSLPSCLACSVLCCITSININVLLEKFCFAAYCLDYVCAECVVVRVNLAVFGSLRWP